MKITLENPSRMILKNYNLSSFLFGIVFFLVGIGAVFLSWKQNIVIVIVCGIFVLVGVFMLANTAIISVILDKGTRKGAFSVHGIIKREAKDIEFANVKELVLERSIGTASGKHGTNTYYQYTLTFALKNGEEIPLDFGRPSTGITSILSSPDEKARKAAQQVADFVGVSLRFVGPPSILDLFSAMKEGIPESAERYDKNKRI